MPGDNGAFHALFRAKHETAVDFYLLKWQAAKEDWKKANPGKEPDANDISNQAYQTFYNKAFAASDFGTGGKV